MIQALTIVTVVLVSVVMFQEADPASDHTTERPPPSTFVAEPLIEVPTVKAQFKVWYAPLPSARATPTEEPTPVPTQLPNKPMPSFSAAVGVLSEEQMRALLGEAGFPPETHDKALVIARCESGWNTGATGSAGERGLFQIHPIHFDSTYDTLGNVRAAYRISSGGRDWSAWSCNR